MGLTFVFFVSLLNKLFLECFSVYRKIEWKVQSLYIPSHTTLFPSLSCYEHLALVCNICYTRGENIGTLLLTNVHKFH